MNFIKLITLAAVAMSFSSCNTIIGVGRDIKQVGTTLGGGVKKGGNALGGGVKKGGDALGTGLENKGYGKTWSGQTNKPIKTAPTY